MPPPCPSHFRQASVEAGLMTGDYVNCAHRCSVRSTLAGRPRRRGIERHLEAG